MQQIQPDLWETELEPVLPGLMTHAYLLVREGGNVLFYTTGHRHEIERMADLGGVSRQYLSHRDEVGDSLLIVRERYGAQLGGHVRERDDFARVRVPDILFDQREMHFGNVEVLPTPGHSPGSTCFLVHSPTGKRYLFTGDTLYLGADGAWRAGLIAPPHATRPPSFRRKPECEAASFCKQPMPLHASRRNRGGHGNPAFSSPGGYDGDAIEVYDLALINPGAPHSDDHPQVRNPRWGTMPGQRRACRRQPP